ncbi:MAG: hypothetical protein MUE82_08020 [Chloroflexi bacterium]|jgi:hypothetical protein|nr:hypothetical protein [Chloroflexota bacterium]
MSAPVPTSITMTLREAAIKVSTAPGPRSGPPGTRPLVWISVRTASTGLSLFIESPEQADALAVACSEARAAFTQEEPA